MNDLLRRILLSVIMLPLSTAILFTVLFMLIGQLKEEFAFIWAWIITFTFVVFYWLGVWRGAVKWTVRRKVRTLLAIPGSIVAGIAVSLVVFSLFMQEVVLLLAGCFAVSFWLLATILIWRETPAERTARLQATAGKAVFCPKCGYNMTGLHESCCPECGEQFTLDQLLAAQQPYRVEDLYGAQASDGLGFQQPIGRNSP